MHAFGPENPGRHRTTVNRPPGIDQAPFGQGGFRRPSPAPDRNRSLQGEKAGRRCFAARQPGERTAKQGIVLRVAQRPDIGTVVGGFGQLGQFRHDARLVSGDLVPVVDPDGDRMHLPFVAAVGDLHPADVLSHGRLADHDQVLPVIGFQPVNDQFAGGRRILRSDYAQAPHIGVVRPDFPLREEPLRLEGGRIPETAVIFLIDQHLPQHLPPRDQTGQPAGYRQLPTAVVPQVEHQMGDPLFSEIAESIVQFV